MSFKKIPNPGLVLSLLLTLFFCFSVTTPAQTGALRQRNEALELIKQNRYIDALPILEKIMLSYPKDAELWAHFGIAIIVNSVTLTKPEERKKEQTRGLKALTLAKQLGTENVRALNLLDEFPADANGEDNFLDDNPEVEKALREGEYFFGRGDYDKAFASYEKAHKINPKSYEAALFTGDSLYAQKKYQESEIWFAKAAAINPNREMAYRYWGDALLNQKKYPEARDKFVEAFVAEPFSRLTWESLNRWGEASENSISVIAVTPPENEPFDKIIINEKLLKADDGTINWKFYNDTRKAQMLAKAGKNLPHTLAEETAAWRKVADATRKDIKAGKIKYPDRSLINLIKIDDDGLLEPYLLLLRPQDDFSDEYFDYREKNREKLRVFVVKYFLGK